MINKNTPITKMSFFAAANGYGGFRSYFGSVFAPERFKALYILKGGPGTGKSSFMKRLISQLEPLADECEAIYCSSDQNSLDGVIISKNGERVAVIDGTAPHSTDPVFPGAVDAIINLGDNWDEDLLTNSRAEIIKISVAKSKAYKRAYDYLSVAGAITEKVDAIINKVYTGGDTSALKDLIPDNVSEKGTTDIRLITCYGKDGFGRLDTLFNMADTIYSVVGVYGSEHIFLSRLLSELDRVGENYILFPTALDEAKIYAVYIPSTKVAVAAEKLAYVSDERVIDTSAFLDQKLLSNEKAILEFLWREREGMLWSAADQFKIASDEHFKLEKIYSAAMNFEKNDKVYDICVSAIKKKLGL